MSRYAVEIEGIQYSVEILEDRGDEVRVRVDGREHRVRISAQADPVAAPVRSLSASPSPALSMPPVRAPVVAGGATGEVRAPMSARVTQILVASGDRVAEGQVLLKIEAMKMENEIRSPVAGAVEQVCVSQDQEVMEGELLVKVKPG